MKNMSLYSVEINNINNEFSFKTEISMLEKSVLLQLLNLNYREKQNNDQHLRDIKLNDYDIRSE